MARERVAIVTRRTPLEELVQQNGSQAHAHFMLESAGEDFGAFEREHQTYAAVLALVRQALAQDVSTREITREQLPDTPFLPNETIVVVGNPGLLANTAKYVGDQPVICINANPERDPDIFTTCQPDEIAGTYAHVRAGTARIRDVTLLDARTEDGRTLRALNDIYVGTRDRRSARYILAQGEMRERQSSDGIIVYTGAGSTAWAASIINSAHALGRQLGFVDEDTPPPDVQVAQDYPDAFYVVSGAYESPATGTRMLAGSVRSGMPLEATSLMPEGCVAFGDGVQEDYLTLAAGETLRITPSPQAMRLVRS